MKATTALCCLTLLVLSLGFPLAGGQRPPASPSAAPTPSPLPSTPWVEATLKKMTLEEKIGQLIFPYFEAAFLGEGSARWQEIERNVTQFHVGGYHAYGGDPAALAYVVNRIQKLAPVPLLITADLEGGAGYEFPGATRLPRAMALGATGSEELAYQAGKITALEGRAMGIGMNFYPVVDVNNNPRNPIINIRSFGEDPAAVSRLARAYIRGSQENGLLAVAKHFPGHGDTSQDSHIELAVVEANRARLEKVELPPFRAAIAEGVAGVMTAHVYARALEPDVAVPASLSPVVTTGLLRQELGFQGLVVTDALSMQGVAARYAPEDVAVRAVKAGADILLIPANVEKTFAGLKSAVEAGEISEARLDASVRRILAAKARLGLDQQRQVDVEALAQTVGSAEHQQQAQEMLERALTLVRDRQGWLPLPMRDTDRVLVINLLDSWQGWTEGVPGRAFVEEFRKRHANTTVVEVSDLTGKETLEVLRKLAQASDMVVANGFIRVAAYKGSIDLSQWQLELLRDLSQMEKPFVFTLFGSPYLLSFVPELPTYILTYEYYPEAERAAVRAIVGEIPFRGHLPIHLPGPEDDPTGGYPMGYGMTPKAQ
jgi:beta-N-acetylhexosaminidase